MNIVWDECTCTLKATQGVMLRHPIREVEHLLEKILISHCGHAADF